MNCKPGDLAITFGAPLDNGLLVEVLFAYDPQGREDSFVGGPLWMVRSLGSPFHFEPSVRRHVVAWPDKLLKPLGDPRSIEPESTDTPTFTDATVLA